LAASVVLLSSAWPLTKQALAAGTTPLWFAEGRAVLSGLTAVVVAAGLGRLRVPDRQDWPAVLAMGGLQIGAYFALAHEAAYFVAAGRTAILANTTTIWIVPLSLVFLHEAIPARRWVAALTGLAGVAVLINPLSIDWSAPGVLIGHLFLLGAALAWSIAIILVRARGPSRPMLELLPWSFLVGALVILPLLLWHAPVGTLGPSGVSWWALGYIGLLAGPFGTLFVMQAQASLPTMVSSIGFLMTPAISILLANFLLREPLTPDLLLGSALIMSGVLVAAWPRSRA
jgi:drug/metabolite transporter (DMT)-like permease